MQARAFIPPRGRARSPKRSPRPSDGRRRRASCRPRAIRAPPACPFHDAPPTESPPTVIHRKRGRCPAPAARRPSTVARADEVVSARVKRGHGRPARHAAGKGQRFSVYALRFFKTRVQAAVYGMVPVAGGRRRESDRGVAAGRSGGHHHIRNRVVRLSRRHI